MLVRFAPMPVAAGTLGPARCRNIAGLQRYPISLTQSASCQRRQASNRDAPAGGNIVVDPSLRWGDGQAMVIQSYRNVP